MAQVVWSDHTTTDEEGKVTEYHKEASLTFDEPETKLLVEILRRNSGWLENLVMENLRLQARQLNEEVIQQKIHDIRLAPGQFGQLGQIRVA